MTDLNKAARDAVEAADNTELVRQIAAVLQAQQIVNAQQQTVVQPVPRREFRASQWLVIGGVVVCVGTVAAFVALALAVAFVTTAVVGTMSLLILRQIWRDLQKRN